MFRRKKNDRETCGKFVQILFKALLHRDPEAETLEMLTGALAKNLSPLELVEGILKSNEYRGIIHSGHVQDFEHNIKVLDFKKSNNKKYLKNIIYFVPSTNKPIGGVKVIIRHCEKINSIFGKNVSAKIFSPSSSNPSLSWLNHGVAIKSDNIFDVGTDFIIIPELWALDYGIMLKSAGINYAIFVQNGYFLFHNIPLDDDFNLKRLHEIYSGAKYIYTISNDTTKCVEQAFGNIKNKIIQLIPSVDTNIFYPIIDKQNIITYMPRKMTQHASWLINQLKISTFPNWQLIPIDKLTENEVGKLLRKSKIFLSFSDQEGFALPPLEAALSGNIVIGYTGQAAKEYWHSPLFKEVECGDLFNFLKKIKETIVEFEEKNILPIEDYKKQIDELRTTYSENKELLKINIMLSELAKLY